LKASALLLSAVLSLFPAVSQAQSTDQKPIKIGILSDMSGPYADQAGVGSVEAAKMAIEDIGGKIGNRTIELVSADHQHKTDVALGIVRRWFDIDGVDVVADMPNSGVALAVQQLTRERNKIALFATAATTELTGKQCSPNGIQWVYDAYSNAAGLAKALIKQGSEKLVLHHRRLRFRAIARTRGEQGHSAGGRLDRRSGAPSSQYRRFQFLSRACVGDSGAGDRARQCRRRHDQFPEAGEGIRTDEQA
jgi:hypothetical protein